VRLPLYACLAVFTLGAGCGSSGPGDSSPIAGTYLATVFKVTPVGQAQIDVLASGGSLSMVISTSNVTSGTLLLPGTVTGGAAFTASMAGTAALSTITSTVTFQQAADTFVRDAIWDAVGTSLSVLNQTIGSATYTITLSRQ
jgi:hypothetical protein